MKKRGGTIAGQRSAQTWAPGGGTPCVVAYSHVRCIVIVSLRSLHNEELGLREAVKVSVEKWQARTLADEGDGGERPSRNTG